MFELLIVAFIIWNEKTEHQRKSNVIGSDANSSGRRMCKWRILCLGNIAVTNKHFADAVKMGKVLDVDKMRMHTLREQGCGSKAIIRAYPYKEWKLRLSRTASSWCQPGSFSRKMALQHTRHVSRRSGCTLTVLRSLRRTVGHQIPRISTPLTITCAL